VDLGLKKIEFELPSFIYLALLLNEGINVVGQVRIIGARGFLESLPIILRASHNFPLNSSQDLNFLRSENLPVKLSTKIGI